MLRIAAVILLACGIFSSAQALTGKCLLRVDGLTYINGPCEIHAGKDYFPDKPSGTFSILSGDHRPAAQVIGSPGDSREGLWNYGHGMSNDTGTLHRDGACWVNEHARICAWK